MSKPGDSLKFLKKDLTVTSEGLVVSLGHKYIDRVCELVGLVNPKRRNIPCPQEILSDDNSPELPAEQASKFRGASALCSMFLPNDRTSTSPLHAWPGVCQSRPGRLDVPRPLDAR